MKKLLPTTRDEMKARGWPACDVIFVTADAYCDHPSFGVALLSRLLEDEGYRVGIIAQPDWRKNDDFLKLGQPALFFGVTAGNLDSMLNIYTSQMNLRKVDKYAPGGVAGLRPKLPTIVYSNKLRELFPKTPVIIGGLEASLRRLGYYDFWSDKVKRSILFDAKADMLVYGMAERQVVEIAKRLKDGGQIENFNDIRGTVVARKDISIFKDIIELPAFEEALQDKNKFLQAFKIYSKHTNPQTAKPLAQKTDTRYCVVLPPAYPLAQKEMDRIYELEFTRTYHLAYEKFGGVPAIKTVQNSVVSHRGCAANCSFCSLSFHQGRVIQSRSIDSIVKEVQKISGLQYFKGTIDDVGGPTANMYGASCAIGHKCGREDCLWPEICLNYQWDEDNALAMLSAVRCVKGVKRVNIQSGVRFDLLLAPKAKKYFKELCQYYVSGQLKIAPEHVSDKVLQLMHKPCFKLYEKFIKIYQDLNKELGKNQFLAQYFITAHPGCDLKDAQELARFTKKMGYTPKQIQDFIPLPMTRSSVMYYTGIDPDTGNPLYVAKGKLERLQQREMIQGPI